jgi:hypothetical protein
MADQAAQDRQEIRELADRYTIGITTRDWALVRSCYHETAHWHASVGLDFQGREALVEGLRAIVESANFHLQMQHAILIENLTADSATARSVLHEVVGRPDGSGLNVLGVYNDRIGKFDGRWLFVERYFDAHYLDPTPLPGKVEVDYKNLFKF